VLNGALGLVEGGYRASPVYSEKDVSHCLVSCKLLEHEP
jgi:hypothetical protein